MISLADDVVDEHMVHLEQTPHKALHHLHINQQ